jgi:hypothetical protein
MNKNIPPVKYDRFDISKFYIEKPQGNTFTTSTQTLNFPRYNNEQFHIQTPMIKIVSGGVPSSNSQFHTTPLSRANNIKIPLDIEDAEILKVYETFQTIDEYLSSEEFKMKQFGNDYKKYNYQSMIRSPPDDSNNKNKYSYIKVKLDCKADKENIDEIKTSVFHKNENDKYEKLSVNSIDDFAKYVRFQGSARFVLSFSKFYILKATKMYGIGLKIKQVQVDLTKNNSKFNNDEPAFEDEDDNQDDDNKTNAGNQITNNPNSSIQIKLNNLQIDSDNEDDELDNHENEDDDDDEEEKVKSKSKVKVSEPESEKQTGKKGKKKN